MKISDKKNLTESDLFYKFREVTYKVSENIAWTQVTGILSGIAGVIIAGVSIPIKTALTLDEVKNNNPDIVLNKLNEQISVFNENHNQNIIVPEVSQVAGVKYTAVTDVSNQITAVIEDKMANFVAGKTFGFSYGTDGELIVSQGQEQLLIDGINFINRWDVKGRYWNQINEAYTNLANSQDAFSHILPEAFLMAGCSVALCTAIPLSKVIYYGTKSYFLKKELKNFKENHSEGDLYKNWVKPNEK